MGSRWKKLRAALGFGNLCVHDPGTLDDDTSPSWFDADERHSDVHSGSVAYGRLNSAPVASRSASIGQALLRTRSASSKKTCTICLGLMKSGNGRALFTAECSHTFHFLCIVSNVKHGNIVCPICRARWKEVPFHAPSSDHGRPSRANPLNCPPDGGQMTVMRRLRRSTSGGGGRQQPLATLFHMSEPASYNDDEPVDPRTEPSRTIEQNSVQAVDIKTHTEFSAIQRSDSKESFAILVHLKAPVSSPSSGRSHSGDAQTSRAPVDLVTVLDVSGSMAGTKLALLKRAMGFVIQNLGPSDRLSVIAFSSTARRLFHLRRMTESGRQHALQAVNSLLSSGGTNIAEGLRKGVKVFDERREKNPVCSIVLLSDGQDTYSAFLGTASRPNYELLLPASVRRRMGTAHHAPVHAFGFGTDHDSASMHSISEASGGTFSFIETENVLQDAFAQCIGGLLSVVVQELRVEVKCVHPGVSICSVRCGSYESEVAGDGRKGSVDLGDLYAEEERDFLVSVKVPSATPQPGAESTVLFKVCCIYRDPVSSETIQVNAEDVIIRRPEVASPVETVTSIDVDRQRNRFRAAEAMADARAFAEKGELSNAIAVLETCRLVLGDTPAARSGDELCVALDAELQEMQERMTSRQRYEASGRAYVLSGLSSHSWQRATTRGSSAGCSSGGHSHQSSYQTPSMVDMLNRSQTMASPRHPRAPPLRPTRSLQRRKS